MYGDGAEHAAADQRKEDEVSEHMSGHQRCQRKLALKCSPRQGEEHVTEQHAAPPLREPRARTRSRSSNCCAARVASP